MHGALWLICLLRHLSVRLTQFLFFLNMSSFFFPPLTPFVPFLLFPATPFIALSLPSLSQSPFQSCWCPQAGYSQPAEQHSPFALIPPPLLCSVVDSAPLEAGCHTYERHATSHCKHASMSSPPHKGACVRITEQIFGQNWNGLMLCMYGDKMHAATRRPALLLKGYC